MSAIGNDVRALVSAFSSKEGAADALAQAQRQEGNFKGQNVQEKDASTALANAAEEMSFAASEKVEKRLSERKAGSKESLKASAAELADKYVNLTGESQSSQKLHDFVDSLKKKAGRLNEQEIRDMLQREFSDISEQYAAIAFAEETLKGEEDPRMKELAKQVSSVKETLMKEAGPAIRAGLNIAGDVLNFAKAGLEQIEKLRELYRFAVLGQPNAKEMYQAIMGRYGETRFDKALDFLLQAASNDLNALGLGPSMVPEHLESAVNNVTYTQYLGNLFRSVTDLLDKVRSDDSQLARRFAFTFSNG